MPTYEIALIMRHALARPQLVDAVKRAGTEIIDRGGYIRQLDYLGDRALPQKGGKGKSKGQTRGHYFLVTADIQIKELASIKDELQRDKDVMRKTFFGIDTTEALREQKPLQCTLEDEFKPPTERPSIQKMIAIGRKKPKHTKIWNPKTGMDYYPFHR